MATTIDVSVDEAQEARDAFAEKIVSTCVNALELTSIYLGVQLGYYAALADGGAMTSNELAISTDSNERYAREWLQQQTIAGVLETEEATQTLQESEYRFRIPDAYVDALVGAGTIQRMGHLSSMVTAVTACMLQAPAVVEAFTTGKGVPFSQYGVACVHGMDAMSKSGDADEFATSWIPALPDIHQRLLAAPPARVAEIGCGGGQMALALARHYPDVQVDGIDIDEASVELARQNAERDGLGNRVNFHCRDALGAEVLGSYDLVVSFACIHDLTDPVGVLRSMRQMVGDTGSVFIQDPLVEPFAGTAGSIPERFAYSASVVHCLPVGMNASPAAGTGTAMQADTMKQYALDAGFSELQIVDAIEQVGFLGFYRLIP